MKNIKFTPTTLGEIRSFDACAEGWKTLCTGLGTSDLDTEVTMSDIIKYNGVEDAFWALRTQDIRLQRLIAADVAESVLHILEEKFPDCKCSRKYIEVIRRWCHGESTDEELVSARRAAYSAANAVSNDEPYNIALHTIYATYIDDAAFHIAYFSTDTNKHQWKNNEDILMKYM